jgi:hypothetical protein
MAGSVGHSCIVKLLAFQRSAELLCVLPLLLLSVIACLAGVLDRWRHASKLNAL